MRSLIRIPLITLFLSLLPLAVLAHPVVSVVLSPATTSNTYSGFVTIQITGLTNGEQVSVQKYLDLNGDHVIDAGEPLVSAFKITDGGTDLIGGVTNINGVYDTDATTGAITATLGFAAPGPWTTWSANISFAWRARRRISPR